MVPIPRNHVAVQLLPGEADRIGVKCLLFWGKIEVHCDSLRYLIFSSGPPPASGRCQPAVRWPVVTIRLQRLLYRGDEFICRKTLWSYLLGTFVSAATGSPLRRGNAFSGTADCLPPNVLCLPSSRTLARSALLLQFLIIDLVG